MFINSHNKIKVGQIKYYFIEYQDRDIFSNNLHYKFGCNLIVTPV